MALVRTDLRNTRESARRIRFEEAVGITATDVQEAIEQVATTPQVVVPTPVDVSPYTPAVTDLVLYVDSSAGPIDIQLTPAVLRLGRAIEILDAAGDANANNITVLPDGAETIDGLASWVIDMNYGGVKLYPRSGVGWKQAT